MKSPGCFVAWSGLALAGLTLNCGGLAVAADAPPAGSVDELFDRPQVYPLTLEVSETALTALHTSPKEYVKVTVLEPGQTFANVGIRIRGGKRFESFDQYPGLVLKFDEFVREARFHGHSRFFLDRPGADRSYLKQAIGGEVFRAAKVPAPKIAFARLTVNGADLGLYLMEQAVNQDFLAAYFSRTRGNLYEGAAADVDEKLEKDGGGRDQEQRDVNALAAAARVADPTERMRALKAVLDVDRFITFAALEVLTAHEKGYTLSRNNYRVYHDPESDRMVFIPHDLDDVFKRPQLPWQPEWKGLVARSLLTTPEGQRRYREQLGRLLADLGDGAALQGRIKTLASIVRPVLAGNFHDAKDFDTAVAQLGDQLAERLRFLNEELRQPAGARAE